VKGRKWTDEERRLFQEQRLRAQTVPDRRKKDAREACRKPVDDTDR
jgi:hypothetical protein